MLLAVPLLFASDVSSVLFILGELEGILDKARTWARHLSQHLLLKTGRDVLPTGTFSLHGPFLSRFWFLTPRVETFLDSGIKS